MIVRRLAMGMLVAATAFSLGSCDTDAGDDASPLATTTTRPAAEATATTDATIRIVLGAGRLTVGGNALPFGAPLFQVSSFLERALGDPATEDDQACDAGELHVLQWATVTAFLGDDGFVGWYSNDPSHATIEGVKVGSSQADLLAAYPEGKITESSLGTEFFVDGGNGGGLSALVESGEVAALWSGATCIAR
jgi:hypothetical protein